MKKLKIGLIREEKSPPDTRVALSPEQCRKLNQQGLVDLVAEPSDTRCFPDADYQYAGITLTKDLSDRDILLGVKEVPVEKLIPNKTYLFFSHTIKEQPYNQSLLQSILAKNIRLIDYEVITDDIGRRLIAFGRFAGMVGAHNAMYTYAKRTAAYDLPRMNALPTYADAKKLYQAVQFPEMRIVLTGDGRVANGAKEVLLDMGIRQVTPESYLNSRFKEAVFTQLGPRHYVRHSQGNTFKLGHFFNHPEAYESAFLPYTQCSDVFINGIYWDTRAPAFFSQDQMKDPGFAIKVIADVTCDIAPESSVPSTIRPSTIAEPIYGFDPQTGEESPPFTDSGIDVMAVDNLPNELPRDASESFGDQLIAHVLPELINMNNSNVVRRAMITESGRLGPEFEYLSAYAGLRNG